MGTVIELAAFRRAKAFPPTAPNAVQPLSVQTAKPRPSATTLSADDQWNALSRPATFKPGTAISSRKKEAVLQLLDFEFPNDIVVDDDGREYLWYVAEHERARAFFRLFGFDIDMLEDADAMHALWLRLDGYSLYVKKYLEDPRWFCESMTCNMPAVWYRYIKAIAQQDQAQAARLSYVLDIDPFTRPTPNTD